LFAHPLGLLALLAVPAVLALHLYRRRFQPRPISGLFLWRVDDRVPLAGRKREPLVKSASLFAELLAAAALGLAFAGPRSSCSGGAAEHLVVVLDSSASMGAEADGEGVRDACVELVRERIDGLGRGSRVTVVRSGSRPELVAGPAAYPNEARERVGEWRPGAARHDLQPALALALELAGGGKVVLVTDRFEPEAWPREVELVSVGKPADNLAITHAARTRDGGSPNDEVFVTVSSFARSTTRTRLRASSEGVEIASDAFEIAGGAREHRSFEIPASTGVLRLEIERDALAVDDVALLAPPASKTVALHASLESEDLRALGLCGSDGTGIARWLELVPNSVEAGSDEAAHLVLARGFHGGKATWCWSLEPQGEERRDLIGPFLAERGHRMLEGATLEGIVWSIDPALALSGAPLISAGNDPILTEERDGDRVLWRANLDIARSSLQRSPDWPILLANAAELRREALPGPQRTNLHVGEALVYRPGSEIASLAPDEVARYTLEGPLGPSSSSREVAALEQVLVEGLEEPGIYRLSYAGAHLAEFALSFSDAAESDLRDLLPGRREAELGSATLESELSGLELLLIALTLGFVAFDWFVLQRAAGYRITA
jgi:hypothetical protein